MNKARRKKLQAISQDLESLRNMLEEVKDEEQEAFGNIETAIN